MFSDGELPSRRLATHQLHPQLVAGGSPAAVESIGYRPKSAGQYLFFLGGGIPSFSDAPIAKQDRIGVGGTGRSPKQSRPSPWKKDQAAKTQQQTGRMDEDDRKCFRLCFPKKPLACLSLVKHSCPETTIRNPNPILILVAKFPIMSPL